MAAGDLATLQQVRDYLQMSTGEIEQDPVIEALITRTSTAIAAHCDRQFAPKQDAVIHRFQVRQDRTWRGMLLLDLAPYDLRAATLVQLHPEESSPTTLTAGTDYLTEPVNQPSGVYDHLLLHGSLPYFTSTVAQRFGAPYLAITGDWGFPDVPDDVQQACILAVATAVRGGVQAFGGALQPNSLGEGVNDPVALPPGVRGLLARHVRHPFL